MTNDTQRAREIAQDFIEREIAQDFLERSPILSPDVLLAQAYLQLLSKVEDLQDHLNTFCKCPSHGASLVQFGDKEFEE